nr:hypothetical protein [Tanacetum cinerariifolium]
MPPEDDVFLAEEQPLPAAVSPTADLPGYITEFDPEKDPEDKDDEDPKEDLADYPVDGDDDEEEEESSKDDVDDKEEDEDKEEKEEEEHLAPADSAPPPIYRTTTRNVYSSLETWILPSGTPPSGTPPLLPIPLPTSPHLLLPSTDCKADVPEVTLPPRKRLCITLGPRFKVEECSSAPTSRPTGGFRADYGFVGTLDAKIRRDPDREIDFVTTVRQDTDEIYGRLDDAQDDRLLMSGQLNLLRRNRRSHACTARLMDSKARASREAWVQSMDASDIARYEVRALQTTVLAQHTEIGDLRAVDRRRQALTLLRRLQT